MSDLTEQMNKGELEGEYYIETTNGEIYSVEFQNSISVKNKKLSKVKSFKGYVYKKTVKEVLAPVPSYEEWKTVFNCANKYEVEYIECANDYENIKKENQQLKTQIAKLTETIGVLPSNHSIGNLGYKIKNQRHEINNRLKEIDKLKELLKDLRDEADGALQAIQKDCESDDFSIFQYPEVQYFYDLLTKIDEVLK